MSKFSFTRRLSAVALVVAFLFSTLHVGVLGQSVGVDTAGMDRSVAPGDDFFLYANGTWFKDTEIPADRTSLGIFQNIAAEVAHTAAVWASDESSAARLKQREKLGLVRN